MVVWNPNKRPDFQDVTLGYLEATQSRCDKILIQGVTPATKLQQDRVY